MKLAVETVDQPQEVLLGSLGLQKVCDIYDFFDPEIDRILRRELRSIPFGSRRAWEFAMIFRALQVKGKLDKNCAGLAMGAGTERLIYAIAPYADRLVVTDLYGMSQGWEGVQTDDPKALIVKRAPWKFDSSRIEALAMDMRTLDFPDETFDFCWSTGAFEHIGDDADFSQHLREVERVLRPGGIYAFTTAIVFGPSTLRIPHNYYFSPEHLLEILDESPLHPESTFDCNLHEHLFNRPHPERLEDYGLRAGSLISKPIISFRRGAMLAANIMVLTKDRERPKRKTQISGIECSREMLGRQKNALIDRQWKDWQIIQTQSSRGDLFIQPQMFGKGHIELSILCSSAIPRNCMGLIKSRSVDKFKEWNEVIRFSVRSGSRSTCKFETLADCIYSLTVQGVGENLLNEVFVSARHISASEGLVFKPSAAFSTQFIASLQKIRVRMAGLITHFLRRQ
jgi:SAM-dependent methyltransferase